MNDDQHYRVKSFEQRNLEAKIVRIKQKRKKEKFRCRDLKRIKFKLLKLLFEYTNNDVFTLIFE